VKTKALITLKKVIKMMLLTNQAYLQVCKLDIIAGSEDCVCLNLISYVSNFDSVVRKFSHYKNHFQYSVIDVCSAAVIGASSLSLSLSF
jgi:hypothetical protein